MCPSGTDCVVIARCARSPPKAAYKICRVATPEAHHSSLITHHFPDNNRRRSFAWRLTLASRRYAPCAPVRLRKATPRTHISILISQIFAVLSKKLT